MIINDEDYSRYFQIKSNESEDSVKEKLKKKKKKVQEVMENVRLEE